MRHDQPAVDKYYLRMDKVKGSEEGNTMHEQILLAEVKDESLLQGRNGIKKEKYSAERFRKAIESMKVDVTDKTNCHEDEIKKILKHGKMEVNTSSVNSAKSCMRSLRKGIEGKKFTQDKTTFALTGAFRNAGKEEDVPEKDESSPVDSKTPAENLSSFVKREMASSSSTAEN